MLRRSVCRADRLIIVESPNKTAKITSILQGAVPDWTFGDGRLSAAVNRYGSANNGREGVAVMATVGHFMDTKDLLISRSDLVLPASAAAATTTVSTAATSAASPSDAAAKKAPKKGGGAKNKKKGSAVDSALLDLPPLPDGAQLLSFVPDLRLRPDNTSMDPIVRYILANNNLNEVILASDPDREGELIAVHALRYLMKKTNLGKQQQQKGGGAHPILFSRAYIQSITEEGVVKAMRERRLQYCDFALAESASARHSMDRIFGWVGSTLMRRIDRSFVSIGRVQTPALILVREQEQKIDAAIEAHKAAFIIQGKFNILGGAGGSGSADEAPVYTRQVTFQIEHPASATGMGATKTASPPAAEGGAAAASAAAAPSSQFTTKEEAEKWLAAQFGGGASAAGGKKDSANEEEDIKQQQQRRLAMSIVKAPALSTGTQKPPVPHTMQSLLTAASNQLKLSSEDVTKCLQELFQSGLITYPRTDSTRLDEAFVAGSLKDYIEKSYGKGSFVDNQSKEKKEKEKGDAKKGNSDDGAAKQKAKKKEKKEENVEDAHEALRPTSLDRHPADPAVLALFGIGTATPAVVAGGGGGGSSSSYSSSPRGNNLASHRSAFPVYKMIYQQTLAAFMAPAETETTTVSVGVRPEPEGGSAAASSSSPMLVAKLTATRLVRPGWRSARLGRDKAAVEEAMAKAKGGNIGGDGPAEGSDGADGADAEAAEGAAAESSATISAFDLIHNLPKYLAATTGDNNKATGNKNTKKEEDSIVAAAAASSVSFHASIGDLRVAEKAVVLPKPFTEGSLIQSLKERGVGRPSTYPAILKTLFDRQYITRDGGQRLHTTPTGKGVVRAARNAFPTLVDIGFTASFERELNAISEYRLDRGEGAAEEKNEAEGGNNGKKAGSKKDNKEKSGLVPLTDKANPDLGEGANPLTCYTLSRLTYSLAGMVDGAVQRHLLMQSYRIADMKSLAAKSRELAASGAGAAAIGEKKGGDASAAAAATPSVGLAPEVAAALKTYGKTSLFERDPSFEAHRNQIAWRTNRIDLPKLLDMVDKGEFKVYAGGNSNNNSNGGNRGGNASQSALEVVSQLTLNLLSSSYMHRHLGIAVGSGAQLHMLGLDETKNPLFQCEADKDRLLSAIPPRPAAAVAASPVAVPRAPIASTTAAPAKVASASSLTTPPAAAATSAAASADGKKDTKEAKPKRSKKASVATATSEGTAAAPRSSSPTTAPATPPAAPVSSSPPVTAGTRPTDAPPKKAFDPMDFFRMGGIRR